MLRKGKELTIDKISNLVNNITMEMNEVITYWNKIYLSGPIDIIEQECRKYALEVGLCVTVDQTKFIYTGGEEFGACVGLINYPRFPSTRVALDEKAHDLAMRILKATAQNSVLIMNPESTRWFSIRK